MNICDLALVIKNHLNEDECQRLISEYQRKRITAKKEHSYHSYEDKMAESSFTRVTIKEGSKHYDLVKTKTEDALNIWLDYLQDKHMFSVSTLRDYLRYPVEFRILKYDVGNFIHPHIDWDYFHNASVTLNLTDDYTGGEFVFMNGERTLSLGKGDALVFPADHYWVHETNPILSGTRYAVNTFITSVHPSSQNNVIGEINKSISEHERIFNR